MLHPAFGVMRPEELIFILANSARRGIREPSVVDSIPKLRESELPPKPFSILASRTLDGLHQARSPNGEGIRRHNLVRLQSLRYASGPWGYLCGHRPCPLSTEYTTSRSN